MLFMCTYQVDRDKQADTQAFFANMTDEQITGEYPVGVKQVGRWHNVPDGYLGAIKPILEHYGDNRLLRLGRDDHLHNCFFFNFHNF